MGIERIWLWDEIAVEWHQLDVDTVTTNPQDIHKAISETIAINMGAPAEDAEAIPITYSVVTTNFSFNVGRWYGGTINDPADILAVFVEMWGSMAEGVAVHLGDEWCPGSELDAVVVLLRAYHLSLHAQLTGTPGP